MFGNKTAERITKVSEKITKNNLETVINQNDKEIPKERYISSEKKTKKILII